METLKVVHNLTTVKYDEETNMWSFELRGKYRQTTSLRLAKDIIDKPSPKNSKFEPIKAFYRPSYSDTAELLTVTSVADNGRHYWTLNVDGKRGKHYATEFYAYSPGNIALHETAEQYRKEVDGLRKKIDQANAGMKKLGEVKTEED